MRYRSKNAPKENSAELATSAQLYLAWHKAGKPVELHIYSKDGHGFGMGTQALPSDHWIDRLRDWFAVQGLLSPAGAPQPQP